jgi:hypothetical protein
MLLAGRRFACRFRRQTCSASGPHVLPRAPPRCLQEETACGRPHGLVSISVSCRAYVITAAIHAAQSTQLTPRTVRAKRLNFTRTLACLSFSSRPPSTVLLHSSLPAHLAGNTRCVANLPKLIGGIWHRAAFFLSFRMCPASASVVFFRRGGGRWVVVDVKGDFPIDGVSRGECVTRH